MPPTPASADPTTFGAGDGEPLDPRPSADRPGSRAARLRAPLVRQVVEAVVVDSGVCVRPLPMRRTSLDTGETQIVPVPCGATLASKCPPCAERACRLRIAQCKAGWHLNDEPLPDPDPPSDDAKALAVLRADLEAARDEVLAAGDVAQVGEIDELIGVPPPGRPVHPNRGRGRGGAWTVQLEAGIDIVLVSKGHGHSSTRVTSDLYTHMLRPVGQDLAERITAAVPRRPLLAHHDHRKGKRR